MVMKVHLLNLAHDILKNNMENGNEFVSKFWKILPLALKDAMKHGDDRGKKAVSRWDSTRKTLVKELEEEGLVLIQCIEKHKVVEASRVILVSQLQDALYEQLAAQKLCILISIRFQGIYPYGNRSNVSLHKEEILLIHHFEINDNMPIRSMCNWQCSGTII
ncbi:Hypothetical predicted protein [Olea europaea subsp. europaea]|uniref:CID domain-containing protein n=1 Tax=Olea europaea subsp. europaea TaxID=158383 RepID=A0A8S0UZN4_OLEEU|nr:Hypothetical predicted protein [Olea europaea subsp. europaea]